MADVSTGLTFDYHFSPSPLIFAGEVDRLGLDIRSFRVPLTRAIQQVMAPSMQENFDMGGRPAWQPVSEATALIKGRMGAPDTPLTRTGELKRNMGYLSMWTITQEDASIDQLPERIFYGTIHQGGSRNGGGRGSNIPQRQFAMFQPDDEDKIREVFDTWLGERVAAAGWA